MPKGYWIAHISITDNDAYQLYRNEVPAILKAHNGKFIVRSGAHIVTEGTARPRTVVIEFPSYQAAQDCYNSPEYQSARKLRMNASEGEFMVIEGWEPAQTPPQLNHTA
jgi:uncharacterized protein (DUF1330 family)